MKLLDDMEDILFECDTKYVHLLDFSPEVIKAISSYLSIERVGGDFSLRRDFHYHVKRIENTTLIKACLFDKCYNILLRNDKLVDGFEGNVYLLDENNIVLIRNEYMTHYKILESGLQLAQNFTRDFNNTIIKFYGDNIIINGRMYSPKIANFIYPQLDEIITPEDFKDEKSIIYDESVCPIELRYAIQDLIKKTNVDIGIKEVKADDQLLNIGNVEYLKTISIMPILKHHYGFNDYFYYDPMTKQIVSETAHNMNDFTEVPRKRLNIITDVMNQQRASELEKGLYVNTILSLSNALPVIEQKEAKQIVEPILSKKYRHNKGQ